MPGDVELNSGVYGVGDREVKLVRRDDLAALVSEVDLAERLGTPEDLQAHEDILDLTAAASPVLPLRFGAVLASEDAVVEALLEPHGDEFVAALEELDGLAEYLIKGRYIEQAILDEILSQDRGAARLRDQIRGADADATRNLRIRLGEIINNSVAAKREEDTRLLLSVMEDLSEASFVRELTRTGCRLRRLPSRYEQGWRIGASNHGFGQPLGRTCGTARPRADGPVRFRGDRPATPGLT